MPFSDFTQRDLYRLLAALCQWVFMGDGEEKEENKGWLGPGQDRETGTGSNSLIYTLHPLCDIPCPAPQEPRALLFLLLS